MIREINNEQKHLGHIEELIQALGEDPLREGLLKTPDRFLKLMQFLTSGYGANPEKIINGALFEEPYGEMICVKDIELYSLCEHHLLPFYGKVHVAYIPAGKIIGLSKIPRIVEIYSKRLQVQERLTTEIAECFKKHVSPKGVGVFIESYHLCMMMRGVSKQNAYAQTISLLGNFKEPEIKNEFLRFIEK